MTGQFRQESDALGSIEVPADRYWGAQTERSRRNFRIGGERMAPALIEAFAWQKKAAALANLRLGLLDPALADAILAAADEVASGRLADHFPLVVWQTGSGTQTNMNVNEVIANRANEILGAPMGRKAPVHPNDHVNLSQSSNDSFPAAMHIAATRLLAARLLPALERLGAALAAKAQAFERIVKIGRTHLQDAVPMTLGQEFQAFAAQVEAARQRLERARPDLSLLAQGGTAVGTGLNAPQGFAAAFCEALSTLTGQDFRPAPNPFAGIAAHDALVGLAGDLATLAAGLAKIAGDIRLLGSGPRCGIGELRLPENEPGSSIMPGKVNPTQAEAMVMVCMRVAGNAVTAQMAGAGGQLQLNACKPVLIDALLQSLTLLADATDSFTEHCVAGIDAEEGRIAEMVGRSLMLVTALAPHIGYDRAAAIARKAHLEGLSLKEAALATGFVTAGDFDRFADPLAMARPQDGEGR